MVAISAEGGCTCGNVRYRMTHTPLFVHCCHCRWCQRETGSAFVLNAMIESNYIELTGAAPVAERIPSESGQGQLVARCPECKVAVWSHYSLPGAISFLRVGTLDNPDAFPPDVHIFTASKQPWVRLGDAAPVYDAYYKRGEIWPEESLTRHKALLDGI